MANEESGARKAAPWLAAALPAAAVYAASRRSPKNLSSIARDIRQHGLKRVVSRDTPTGQVVDRSKGMFGKVRDYLEHGTTDVAKIPDGVYLPSRAKRTKKVLYTPNPDDLAFFKGRRNVGAGKPKSNMANKAIEADVFQKHAPGAMPETHRVSRLSKEWAKSPQSVQASIEQKFGKDYVLKDVGGAQTGSNVITGADDLAKIYAARTQARQQGVRVGKEILPWNKYDKIRRRGGDELGKIYSGNPELAKAEVVHKAVRDPRSVIAQKKLDIKQQSLPERMVGKVLSRKFGLERKPSGREIRVHAVGDQVLNRTTVDRNSPVRAIGNVLGIKGKNERAAEKFVQETLRKLPQNQKKNVSFNVDVAMTKQGPKIIETNPTGQSGFIDPPVVGGRLQKAIARTTSAIQSHRAVSDLQGRATHALAGARAGVAGAAGLGAYSAADQMAKKRRSG